MSEDPNWRDAGLDLHHRPIRIDAVMAVLQECRDRLPDCWVGRSGHGTGDLCVYDADGDYVGVITLGSMPEFDLFDDSE